MRICTVCQLELADSLFYKRSNGVLRSVCIQCTKAYSKQYHLSHKEQDCKRQSNHYNNNKEHYQKCHAIYRRSPQGKEIIDKSKSKFASSAHGKQAIVASQKKWDHMNPVKRRAHWIVNKDIKRGKLQRMPCEICGNIKSEAHHEDYTKPRDIVWLCIDHHKERHRKICLNLEELPVLTTTRNP